MPGYRLLIVAVIAGLWLSGCALRPRVQVTEADLQAFSQYSAELIQAIDERDLQRVTSSISAWSAAHPPLAAEGDLYASLLTEAARMPHPHQVYAAVAATMIDRFPAHPALWSAWTIQVRHALDSGDPAAAVGMWEHVSTAPRALQRELAAGIAELLWNRGQFQAAVEWAVRGAPEHEAPLFWRLWAARVWNCCPGAGDAGDLLGAVAQFASAVRSPDTDRQLAAARQLRRQDIRAGEPLRTLREMADRLLDGSLADDRDAMGAVLPMNGISSALGRSVLGVAAACMPDGRIDVVDTRSRVAGAAVALNATRSEALLGPLRSSALERLGWTMLRRGQIVATPNPNPVASYPVSAPIWSTALAPEEQARAIASFLAEQGWRAVAVLHPDDAYGTRFISVFWDAVLDHGGWFTGISAFTPRSTDFGPAIRRLVGLDRFSADEVREMKKNGEEPQPIIDFDALVIVGSPAELSLIPAQLAYYDVYDVRLIGDAAWRDPRIPRIAGKYMDGLLFVDVDIREDGWYPDCATRAGMSPGPLSIAVLDAVSLLRETQRIGRAPGEFPGVSGSTTVSPGHTVERRFRVWQWRRGQLAPWDGTDPVRQVDTSAEEGGETPTGTRPDAD